MTNKRKKFKLVAEIEFEGFSAAIGESVPTTEVRARIKAAMQSAIYQLASTATFSDVTQNFHLRVEDK